MNTRIIRINDLTELQKIILLPEPDEMTRIWTIINEHGFVFDRFTLVVKPLQNTFKIHIEGLNDNQVIHIKRIWKDRKGIAHTENRDVTIDMLFEKYAELMENVFKDGYKAAISNESVDLLCPFHFIQYVIYSELHRSVEYIEPAKRKPGNKTHSKAKSGTQELSLTDCISIYHHVNKNRSYTRKTESWERRGGVRHLKSGKVVPYKASTCHAKDKPADNNENNTKFYKL